jgi:hypothetical protein
MVSKGTIWNWLKKITCKAYKVKGLPLTHFEGTERGLEVQFHSFLTSALDGGRWSTRRPSRLTPGTQPLCISYRRLNGPRGRSGRMWRRENLLVSLGFETWTDQPLASLYTDPFESIAKSIPVQASYRPRGFQDLEGQISIQSSHDGGKIISSTHRLSLPTRKYIWFWFLLEGVSAPEL